jgi:hypothetical protein
VCEEFYDTLHEGYCDASPANVSVDIEFSRGGQAGARDDCQCRRYGARGSPVATDTDIVHLDWGGDLNVNPDVDLTAEPLLVHGTVGSLADISLSASTLGVSKCAPIALQPEEIIFWRCAVIGPCSGLMWMLIRG